MYVCMYVCICVYIYTCYVLYMIVICLSCWSNLADCNFAGHDNNIVIVIVIIITHTVTTTTFIYHNTKHNTVGQTTYFNSSTCVWTSCFIYFVRGLRKASQEWSPIGCTCVYIYIYIQQQYYR